MDREPQCAIEVKNLVKDFRISHNAGNLKSQMASFVQSTLINRRKTVETRRILDDISLCIQPGEGIGLIGRNGSGKSTLLGMMARIYKPTSGNVVVNGRLVALLELGAGFNLDLTGVQNVYFNGAILGLTRRQVTERFDSIVAFAELQEFIDAPLRNYSSGMQLRLGFALAVHVDADILLVDEALAVGDQAFQQKCYAKINELKLAGKTIILVSHNPNDIRRVASRVLWLKRGRIAAEGDAETVLKEYDREMALP